MDDIEWTDLVDAHEIINIDGVLTDPSKAMATYKAADDPDSPGDTMIPDSVWDAGYEPPLPYIANTTRNLQFNQSSFIASPGEPDGVMSYVFTSDGYSWGAMSEAINAMWPYNSADYTGLSAVNAYYAGNLVTDPPDGVVKVTANFKAQYMKFWANENGVEPGTEGAVPLNRYIVKDEWGNKYIMHASGQSDPEAVAQAFEDAVLPEGWTKKVKQLSQDKILSPAEASDGSYHYLVFRDSADNSYHQISWSGKGSLASEIDGMPIWGGQTDDTVSGHGTDDLVHGAGGDDLVRGRKGNDTLYGDAGDDKLKGGKDDDILNGNGGTDALIGGKGSDQFVLQNLNQADWIKDFKSGDDKIVLASGEFDVFGDTLGKDEFRLVGEKPEGDTPSLVYNPESGKLWFDQGDGRHTVPMAILPNDPFLSHTDFLMDVI
jgi:Ca2+-binding RTX toxin-like protein